MLRSTTTHAALAGILLFAAAGCGDPIIGDWKMNNNCGKSSMTIEDGSGDGYLMLYTNTCTKCDFTFDWTNKGDDKYTADVTFKECNCNGNKGGEATCKMKSDGQTMNCQMWVGTCDLGAEDWDKE